MKQIKIYNSLTNKIETTFFNENIFIYLCGPTVYNEVHIGNIRPVIFVDLLVRVLKYLKYNVHYWQNITDINDKIVKVAETISKSEMWVARKYTKHYLDILKEMNIIYPNNIVNVSSNIQNIAQYIQLLIDKDFAYKIGSGIYFQINKLKQYNVLSNNSSLRLQDSEKSDYHGDKRNKNDFVLWKFTNTKWGFNSILGNGRPGWHTECAYFNYLLSRENAGIIDIHVGGKDLIFPHHENELAQHNALFGNLLANFWIHVGQVNINQQKMSKSLQNYILAKNFINQYGANVLRYCLLSTSFTKPISIGNGIISISVKKIQNWTILLKSSEKIDYQIINSNFVEQIINALSSNFNMSIVFAEIDKLIKENQKDSLNRIFLSSLRWCIELLGFKI